jgi:phytoene dehydrogenase-like protein
VLADTGAPQLFLELVGEQHLPAGYLDDVRRFEYDPGTVKLDWALDGPIPWTAPEARRAPVVHVAEGMDELTVQAAELARGLVPAKPFLVFGQYSMGDPTRAPEGKETAWAYTRVPQRVRGDAGADGLSGSWDARETEAFAARIEERVEALAPGFRGLVRARHLLAPPALERANRNLVGGAINGGTAQLHQQLVFRPVPGLARPGTPVRGLYLASASAHPGGGVHGACGANAARAALAERRAGRVAVAVGAVAGLAYVVRRSRDDSGGIR